MLNECMGVGLIGCGAISVNHFKALQQVKNARLVAVCDNDPEHLQKAIDGQGVRGYSDYHELLRDPEVQVVHICTPHYLHHQMAIDALHAGKHVLCEKPMAIHLADAEKMTEAAKETGNYAIGVDSDQKYINPDVIICSMVKNVGKSVMDIVEHMDERYQPATVWKADMATGYIDVGYGDDTMTQQVSDELKAEVEELKAKIISGEIVVPTALN